MTTGRGCGCDDCKCNANGECPADLEKGAKGRHPDRVLEVDGKACDGCDTGKSVASFIRSGILEEQLATRTRRRIHLSLLPCILEAISVCEL